MEVTINYKGIDLIAKGDYEQYEEPVWYDSEMSGSPGCSAEFQIYEIRLFDSDINIYVLFEDELEYIEELCLEAV